MFNRIAESVKDLDISILLNNVGVDLTVCDMKFHSTKIKTMIDNIVVNTVPSVLLTRSLIN